jgi:hypothetical protein
VFPFARVGPEGVGIGLPGQSVHIGEMVIRGRDVTIKGSTASCLVCGTPSRIPDGFYSFVRQGIAFARRLTPDEAAAVVRALRSYRAGDATEEEVVAAAPASSANFIASLLKRIDTKYWAGILVAVILALWAKTDTADIQRQDAAIEQQLRQVSEEEQAIVAKPGDGRPSRAPADEIRRKVATSRTSSR